MAWVTVRNEGESYLYTYLRSGTGTTGPKGSDRYSQPTRNFVRK
jgi:hypothetical protein